MTVWLLVLALLAVGVVLLVAGAVAEHRQVTERRQQDQSMPDPWAR